eukprot:TRINITY_DN22977_c0_g1_i1.p1 TRINITY_DN22977_c0_g1~~TRINITY_DN22977_c0_g1_i1.p1  ORF type:complete len:156 (-),score=18.29 TRINITY_DN22977_c0_g1_i1:136-603(-)
MWMRHQCFVLSVLLSGAVRVSRQHFILCIFIASQEQQNFLQINNFFEQVFTHNDCTEVQPNIFVKDLRKFSIPLSDIVLVDNVIYSFGVQIDNGIPVKNFQRERDDCQLVALTQFLMKLKDEKDVREINRSIFKVKKFIEQADPEVVIKTNFKVE